MPGGEVAARTQRAPFTRQIHLRSQAEQRVYALVKGGLRRRTIMEHPVPLPLKAGAGNHLNELLVITC